MKINKDLMKLEKSIKNRILKRYGTAGLESGEDVITLDEAIEYTRIGFKYGYKKGKCSKKIVDKELKMIIENNIEEGIYHRDEFSYINWEGVEEDLNS